MKRSKLLALSAITLLGFSACQKPELESELTSGVTHTVTFVAGAPETKTTVDISDGATAKSLRGPSTISLDLPFTKIELLQKRLMVS